MENVYHGRTVIYTDEAVITEKNIAEVLSRALAVHKTNSAEIEYLYDYYRGVQPILYREKEVRPEIMNIVIENRANEIVTFKTGYLMGEPVQYVSKTDDEMVSEDIMKLNDYVSSEDKAAKDKELADWFHICGTSYRMVVPDSSVGEDDEVPFEIYTLDPRNTFVVYYNDLARQPIMAVKYITKSDGSTIYSCYTKDRYYEVLEAIKVIKSEPQPLGIPIIEYPANTARMGAFEVVLPLLNAINTVDSNRLDGVEQFVQALMVFYNVDISAEDYDKLRQYGAIKVSDIDSQTKARIEYLAEQLNQTETQTLVDHLYDTVLTICGMPNRNGGSSTSDTGSAVIMRDGWSAAEARAKDTELLFKKSEKSFLKLLLKICDDLGDLKLKLSSIEIRFTRRNYENIMEKATVLNMMLNNPKIAPQLAYTHSGMFVDPGVAYNMSKKYQESQAEVLQTSGTDDNMLSGEGSVNVEKNTTSQM